MLGQHHRVIAQFDVVLRHLPRLALGAGRYRGGVAVKLGFIDIFFLISHHFHFPFS